MGHFRPIARFVCVRVHCVCVGGGGGGGIVAYFKNRDQIINVSLIGHASQ